MLHIDIKFQPFSWASESCQKSRAKNIRNFLSVLDALGAKSESFQPMLYEKQKIIFLILFADSFSIGLIFGNFFIERCYKHYELGGGAGVG